MVVGLGGGDEMVISVGLVGDDDASDDIDNVTNSLGDLNKAAVLANGALLALSAGGLAKSASAAAKWEEALVDVAKVTNEATASELDASLRELGSTMPVATGELADVAAAAGRLGIQGAENIENFTATMAKVDVATDQTADEAATNMARMSNALDVPVEKVENMASSMNRLSNTAPATFSEVSEATLRAAPSAAQLGVEFEDLAALSTTLIASGQRVRRAGTRLNRAFAKLAGKSGEVAEFLGMTNEEFQRMLDRSPTDALLTVVSKLQSMESQAKATKVATEIFGAAGAKAILGLAKSSDKLEENLRNSNEAFEEGTSIQEEYEAASDTLSKELTKTNNLLFDIGVTIGKTILPALKGALEIVNSLLGAFDMLNDATEGVAGSAALLAGVLVGGHGLLSALSALPGVTGAVATGLLSVAGPIALLIGLVGALSAAWATDFGSIRTTTKNAVDDISRSLSRLSVNAEGELGKTMDLWKRWEIRFAAGLDVIETAIAQTVDAIVMLIEMASEAISTGTQQLAAIKDGDFQRAREIGQEGNQEMKDLWSEFRDRTDTRITGLEGRNRQRRVALESGDPSLLPANLERRSDEDDEQKKRDDRRDQYLDRLLDRVDKTNQKMQEQVQEQKGTRSSVCPDAILDPLERVPRPEDTSQTTTAPTAGTGTGTTAGSGGAAAMLTNRDPGSGDAETSLEAMKELTRRDPGSGELEVEMNMDGRTLAERQEETEQELVHDFTIS